MLDIADLKDMLKLDADLINCIRLIKHHNERHTSLAEQLIEMRSELYDIECKIDCTMKKIEDITNEILDSNSCIFNKDPFINDFIRASFFASRDVDRYKFQFVNITDSYIQATNAHMLISIKCPFIPHELKNTKILWDVRYNFKGHINTSVEFPDFNDGLPKRDNYVLFGGINPANFYNLFDTEITEIYTDKKEADIDFAGVKLMLNKKYLDTALLCIGNDFDLYIRGPFDPLIMESKDTLIAICPMRTAS